MLKGIVIAASGTGLLKETLTREGLSWVEIEKREKADFLRALKTLGVEQKEVLCLVERDREEAIAMELGLFCVGYLNPVFPEESLSGCHVLLEGFQEIDRMFLEHVHTRACGLPVQIAKTRRLLIREMTLADLDAIHALYQEEELAVLFPEFSADRQEEEERIKAYITYMYGMYQFGMWVVIERESGKLIGRAGFGIADYLDFSEVDMGYLIDQKYRHQGYGEEACRAVLKYAGSVLEFPGVSAYVGSSNEASVHLLEKLGFCKKQEFVYKERELCRYFLDFS